MPSLRGCYDARVSHDPITLFLERRRAAVAAGAGFDGTAAVLATADRDGRPAARWVLVKDVGPEGLLVFTNYESRKAQDIEANPRVALAMHWPEIDEQFRFEGRAERLSAGESDAYHAARPRGSQIAAWASPQSRPIESREALAVRVTEIEARFDGVEVPRPPFWGGYRVVPDRAERWINGADRLHDRFVYTRDGDGWTCERWAP